MRDCWATCSHGHVNLHPLGSTVYSLCTLHVDTTCSVGLERRHSPPASLFHFISFCEPSQGRYIFTHSVVLRRIRSIRQVSSLSAFQEHLGNTRMGLVSSKGVRSQGKRKVLQCCVQVSCWYVTPISINNDAHCSWKSGWLIQNLH